MIYELDYDFRLEELQKNINYVKNINDSLADKRDKYRIFSDENEINFNSLEKCLKMYERTVLIDAYTLAEQLIKNVYYELIDKDRQENGRLKQFINRKVNPEKFSPNVKYKLIEKSIATDLIDGFKFIFSARNDEITTYNYMIDSRHKYAHNGEYYFNEDKFNEAVKVIDYIYIELRMVIDHENTYRIDYQEKFKLIKEMMIGTEKCIKNYKDKGENGILKEVRNKLKEIKKECNYIVDNYSAYLVRCELLTDIYNDILWFSNMDLRKVNNNICFFQEHSKNIKNKVL